MEAIYENNEEIVILTIVGEVEGHEALSDNTKTTKYEHVIPQLVAIEESDEVAEYAQKYEVYQIFVIKGIVCDQKAQGTIYKVMEAGTAEVEYFKYPERITKKTKDSYEFELSPDVLEIMPYGVAADLLKNDISANYGKVYSERYETMLQRLDPRYSTPSICIEGGVDI